MELKEPTGILFLCHGNICRSPMAEFILKDLAQKAGVSDTLEIASAATSREEIGNDIYAPARQVMRRHGVAFESRFARQVTERDMEHFDLIVVMDDNNLRWLDRMFGSKYDAKIRRLMSFAGESRDVSDPWYTGDFEQAYSDILAGCKGLMESLI